MNKQASKEKINLLYVMYPDYIFNNGIIASQVFNLLEKIKIQYGTEINIHILSYIPVFHLLKNLSGYYRLKKQLAAIHIRLYVSFALLKSRWIPYFESIFFLHTILPIYLVSLIKRINVIHARDIFAGKIAIQVARFLKIKNILDVRGIYPEEAVLRGAIKSDSNTYCRLKILERNSIKSASYITAVSEYLKNHLLSVYPRKDIMVIPCSVDMDKFKRNESERHKLRQYFKLNNKKVIVYAGSLGTWTDAEQVAAAYRLLFRTNIGTFLLVLTTSDKAELIEKLKLCEIPPDNYLILALKQVEVGTYLNIADCAFLLRKESIVNKIAITTKFGEYMAMGLPVIVNPAAFYITELVNQYNLGIEITGMNEQDMIERLGYWLRHDLDHQINNCIQFAEKNLSMATLLKNYVKLYRSALFD